MATEPPIAAHAVHEDDPDAKRAKHDRSSRACLVCRQRKVKCDALECYPNKCTNCVQFNIKNCFLPAPKKRKSKKIEELLKANTSLQRSPDPIVELNELPPQADIAPSFAFPFFVGPDMQERHRDLSEVKLDPARVMRHDTNSLENNAEFSDWIRPSMSTVLTSYLSQHFDGPKGYPKISRTDFAYLVHSGCFYLPNADTCWKWIDAFFNYRWCQFPVLVESKFREEYKDLTNPPSLLLLHSIIYCGAKYYDDPSWTTEDKLNHIEKTEILYNRALVYYEKKIELDLLCQLQSLMIMGNYKNANVQCLRADPTFIRSSLNLCYSLGIHNSSDMLNVPEATRRIYRRIWWTLFVTDTLYSFIFCKPWSMDDTISSDVPMITKEDLREDPNDPSDDQTYETLYFIHRVKLTLCIRKICENMNRLGRQTSKLGSSNCSNCIGECEQMMRDWIEQLPSSLLFKLNSPSNNAFNASLSLEYYSALLLLYRMYFLNSLKPYYKEPSFPSWGIVFKAAHMVALIARYVLENNCISFCQMMVPFAMNIAGLMMIYHLYNKDKKVHNIAKKDIEIFLELLYEVSYKHTYARLTYFYLKALYEDKTMQAKMLNEMLNDSNKVSVPKVSTGESPVRKESANGKVAGTANGGANGKDVANGNSVHSRSKPTLPSSEKAQASIGLGKAESKEEEEFGEKDMTSSTDKLRSSLTNVPVNSILYSNNHNMKMPEILSFSSSQRHRRNMPSESRSTSMSSTSAFLNSHSQILPLPVMENQIPPPSPTPFATTPGGYSGQFTPSFIPPNIIPQRDPPFMHFRHTPIEVKPSPMMNMNIHPGQQQIAPAIASNTGFSEAITPGSASVFQSNLDNNMADSPSKYTPEQPLARPALAENTTTANYGNIATSPSTGHMRSGMGSNNNHFATPITFGSSNKINPDNVDDGYRMYDAENHNVLSQKFDLVMPPDMLPGIDTSNWRPEFDTSLLPFSDVDSIHTNFDFDHNYMDFPL